VVLPFCSTVLVDEPGGPLCVTVDELPGDVVVVVVPWSDDDEDEDDLLLSLQAPSARTAAAARTHFAFMVAPARSSGRLRPAFGVNGAADDRFRAWKRP
jgi:hypothetical protein